MTVVRQTLTVGDPLDVTYWFAYLGSHLIACSLVNRQVKERPHGKTTFVTRDKPRARRSFTLCFCQYIILLFCILMSIELLVKVPVYGNTLPISTVKVNNKSISISGEKITHRNICRIFQIRTSSSWIRWTSETPCVRIKFLISLCYQRCSRDSQLLPSRSLTGFPILIAR